MNYSSGTTHYLKRDKFNTFNEKLGLKSENMGQIDNFNAKIASKWRDPVQGRRRLLGSSR